LSHVLIVDDKPENLYLLRVLLQGHGYEVEEARDGAQALQRARQQLPALIVSDLLMPVMDGYTPAAPVQGRSAVVQRALRGLHRHLHRAA
jgi:CheY-like chemotaxis protein